jgi:succinate-semialdehyde dehydrogenase / glutarate-semialdehyde dehydrogenase
MSTLEPIPVLNPRTGRVDYTVQPPTEAALDAACRELRAAQAAWATQPLQGRIDVLRRWAGAIRRHAQAIGDAEEQDTGRRRLSHEVPHMVAGSIDGWADKAPGIIAGAHLSGTSTIYPTVDYETQLVPYPLLGVISPWNHPFLLSMIDAVPALLAGCAVIVKPSEVAPRFIEPVMRSIADVPELAAVLRYVAGGPATGRQIIDRVDALCFTGSVNTGRKIALACAERFIPVFLELGGKDAAIVTASADLDRATAAIVRGSVFATGQICFSTERVYVQASVHDALVERLVARSDALRLTYPDAGSGDIGPFIFRPQARIVDEHIDDALAKGARLVAGGRSRELGGGLYMPAGVLTEVDHGMRIMREETFGPVTPVMRYDTEDEAVALANDTHYGLSAAVFGGDVDEARRIGRRLHAGGVSLQDAAITIAILRDAEKTSFNQSGLGGSRMGPAGLLRFFRKKAFMVNHGAPGEMAALAEDQR